MYPGTGGPEKMVFPDGGSNPFASPQSPLRYASSAAPISSPDIRAPGNPQRGWRREDSDLGEEADAEEDSSPSHHDPQPPPAFASMAQASFPPIQDPFSSRGSVIWSQLPNSDPFSASAAAHPHLRHPTVLRTPKRKAPTSDPDSPADEIGQEPSKRPRVSSAAAIEEGVDSDGDVEMNMSREDRSEEAELPSTVRGTGGPAPTVGQRRGATVAEVSDGPTGAGDGERPWKKQRRAAGETSSSAEREEEEEVMDLWVDAVRTPSRPQRRRGRFVTPDKREQERTPPPGHGVGDIPRSRRRSSRLSALLRSSDTDGDDDSEEEGRGADAVEPQRPRREGWMNRKRANRARREDDSDVEMESRSRPKRAKTAASSSLPMGAETVEDGPDESQSRPADRPTGYVGRQQDASPPPSSTDEAEEKAEVRRREEGKGASPSASAAPRSSSTEYASSVPIRESIYGTRSRKSRPPSQGERSVPSAAASSASSASGPRDTSANRRSSSTTADELKLKRERQQKEKEAITRLRRKWEPIIAAQVDGKSYYELCRMFYPQVRLGYVLQSSSKRKREKPHPRHSS